jgi:hypothetical protein
MNKKTLLLLTTFLIPACVTVSETISTPTYEPIVDGSCRQYSKQCSDCIDTLQKERDRTGSPELNSMDCSACRQQEALCSSKMPDTIKAWPTQIPPTPKRPKLKEEEKKNKDNNNNEEDKEDTTVLDTQDVEQEAE